MSIVFIISEVLGYERRSVVNPALEVLDGLDLAIPYITRSSEVTENQNSLFIFTSPESFELMIARGEFLEHVNILGNYYGTPYKVLQQAQENGNDLLVKADHSGVEQIKSKVSDAVSILIMPAQSARATTISRTAINPSSATPFREFLQPSIQEVLSQRQAPRRDYDHTVVYDRTKDGVARLIEIIRRERLRRQIH